MTASGYSAIICRGGFAAALRAPSGQTLTLRRRDLETDFDPTDDLGSARLAEVRLKGDEALFTYTDGAALSQSLTQLFTPHRPEAELVVEDARVMTCAGPADSPLGIVTDGAIVVGGGRLLWVGKRTELGDSGLDLDGAETLAAEGRLLTPGLIDCHAHPIYAGNRAGEFAMRAAGDSYQSIAERGGGIVATVEPTRAASMAELVDSTRRRMQRAFATGTTTCEAKSGYALTTEGELRLLEVACAVDALGPVELSPTLLGAHVVPAERVGDRDRYVIEVAEEMVPAAAIADLATAVDVYCDQGAFTLEETRTILEAGRAAGLHVRAHVGQFADLGGPELVASLGGLSVDHLEEVSEAGIRAIADAGVVAVMLPTACVQLRQEPPPVAALRDAGVALAVATDMNPGSSNCERLPIAMWLATTHYGMTVEETWLGVTRTAARAAGIARAGQLRAGFRADLVLWDCEHPAAIPYECGRNLVLAVVKAGRRYGAWA